jgi:zinc/manganese transport system substrate-binding protein
VTQHASFGYTWNWLGFKLAGDLEPKPGMPPTPGHLERLRDQIKASPIQAIVIAQHHDKRPAHWLVQQESTGNVRLIILPATVPEMSPTSLVSWLDGLVEALSQNIP